MDFWEWFLKGELSVSDCIQTLALVIQTLAFIVAAIAIIKEAKRFRAGQEDTAKERKEAAKERKEDDTRAFEARKIEIYQRLEIESNRVFEFEASYPELVPEMKRRLGPRSGIKALIVPDKKGKNMSARQVAMIARKYYEMNCNLFEIAARLRKKRLIDDHVFGSWVAWYFDTCTEWGFRALWADLRDNYTADLRRIFDPLCISLINEWDMPHAQGTFTAKVTVDDIDDDVDPVELEKRREEFYHGVAKAIGGEGSPCPVIAGWLNRVQETALPAQHPLAYT